MYVLGKTDPLTGLGGKVSQRPATLGQCARQSCLQTTPPRPGINRYDGTTTPFSVSFATTLTVGYGSPIAGRLQNRENKKKRDGRILRIFSGSKPLGKAIKYNKIEAGEPPGAASRPPALPASTGRRVELRLHQGGDGLARLGEAVYLQPHKADIVRKLMVLGKGQRPGMDVVHQSLQILVSQL